MLAIIVILAAIVGLVVAVFVLGFQTGGRHWQSELQRTRMVAARAERQLHDLTRDTFVAMADSVIDHRDSTTT